MPLGVKEVEPTITWVCRGHRFELKPPHPYSLYKTSFLGNLFSAFEFSELDSDHGFAVILKQMASSHFGLEHLCEPSAAIVERLQDLNSVSYKLERRSQKTEFETDLNFRAGRISWQHPVWKWWVKVIIKKELVDHERAVVVYISCHPPEQVETSDT